MRQYEYDWEPEEMEAFIQTVTYSPREYRREFMRLSPPELEILQELNRQEAKRLYSETNND